MSGIEVVGILLGVLPIVLAAVEAGRSIVDDSANILHDLETAVTLHRNALTRSVKTILRKTGYDVVCSPTSQEALFDLLRDPDVQRNVNHFLGEERLNYFNLLGQQCNKAVDKIFKCLIGTVPHDKKSIRDVHKDHLKRDRWPRWLISLIQRSELIIKLPALKRAMERLDKTTDLLSSFNSSIKHDCSVGQESMMEAANLVGSLRQARQFSMAVYQAISHLSGTECHARHEVSLFLEGRIGVGQYGARPESGYQIILAAMDNSGGIQTWSEMPIEMEMESSPSTSNGTRPEAVALVDDVCNAIERIRSTGMRCRTTFLLTENSQIGEAQTGRMALIPRDDCSKLSLKDTLSQGALPLGIRMNIALRAASSMLQLAQTDWIETPWSKDMIYFLHVPDQSASGGRGKIALGRPFISATLDDAAQPRRQTNAQTNLLELGILLLELWHGRTLEAQFSLSEPPAFDDRYALASRWLNDGIDAPMDAYNSAVRYCIHRATGGSTAAFWSCMDDIFWVGVCRNVLRPLCSVCDQWARL